MSENLSHAKMRMNRRPGNSVSEYPSYSSEIARGELEARAYERNRQDLIEIELYSEQTPGWSKRPFGNESFNDIYNVGYDRRSEGLLKTVIDSNEIIKKRTFIRGFGEHSPFVNRLERSILTSPEKYYKGNYRIGRGYAMEPASEGSEGFYD
jgi:hypothetical protein